MVAKTPAFQAPTHPNRDVALEAMLTDRGIAAEFVQIELNDVIMDETVQVRLGSNRAPKRNVVQYSEAMKAGADFPAPLVTSDNAMIDGNTRFEARKRIGDTRMWVYRITESGIGNDVYRLLSVELNQRNGQRMDPKDLLAVVVAYIQAHLGERIDVTRLAARTGVPKAKVSSILKSLTFDVTAEAAGIPAATVAGLTDSAKSRLSKLTSQPLLRRAADITVRANLSTVEIGELVSSTLEAAKTSEAAALAALADAETSYAERIRTGGTVGSRPTAMGKHAMHLTYIVSKVNPDDILGVDPADRERFAAEARQVIRIMEAMIARAEGREGQLTIDSVPDVVASAAADETLATKVA